MLEQEEYQAVFSALDKHVNLETFKNIILDKCGDDDYSVKFGSNDNIEFSDQAKEKLRFLNNTSALIYSKRCRSQNGKRNTYCAGGNKLYILL